VFLYDLKLSGFKSYGSARFEFEERISAFTGKNGIGKTNLLDALHHLSLGRSAFHKQDALNIRHGDAFYRLDAHLKDGERTHRLELVYTPEEKKKLSWDGSEVERISQHVGRLPMVLILPDEPYQMNESSEWRRNFIDNTLSQAFPAYLHHLSRFKKLLNQRNASLKYFADRRKVDFSLLDTIDEEILLDTQPIFQYRQTYLPQLNVALQEQYRFLSMNAEEAGMDYESELLEFSMEDLFRRNRQVDLETQRTLSGLHRDDYKYRLDGRPLKKLGSQGQQKTFLLALKLAQYEFLKEQKNQLPWLLLDDIFDKLDDLRIGKLLERIAEPTVGQVFLTDAREERTRQLMEQSGIPCRQIPITPTA
jgi:DNA replication and repair protein RecF